MREINKNVKSVLHFLLNNKLLFILHELFCQFELLVTLFFTSFVYCLFKHTYFFVLKKDGVIGKFLVYFFYHSFTCKTMNKMYYLDFIWSKIKVRVTVKKSFLQTKQKMKPLCKNFYTLFRRMSILWK